LDFNVYQYGSLVCKLTSDRNIEGVRCKMITPHMYLLTKHHPLITSVPYTSLHRVISL